MVGLHVQLDVEYANDPKMIDAGPMAELLYVRSLCFAKRTMRDGVIARSQLRAIALGIPTVSRQVQRLVEVGAWEIVPEGWRITAWLKRNKSAEQIADDSAAKKLKSLMGNHERWHVKEDKYDPTCPLCRSLRGSLQGSLRGSHSFSTEEEEEEEAQPEEEEEAQPEEEEGSPGGARPPLTAASCGEQRRDRDFDAFWQLYPRKIDRKKAETAWKHLPKRDRAAALEALPAHIALWETEHREPRFIQHPTSWLHGRRWSDELNGHTPPARYVDGHLRLDR